MGVVMALRRNYIQKTTGRKVKGVTTHLGILNKPALIWWGYKQGFDNYERLSAEVASIAHAGNVSSLLLANLVSTFPVLNLYDKRDQAAEAGTLAHEMVENDLRGLPEPKVDGEPKEVIDKAEGCYLTFLDWKKIYKPKVIASEVALTSEQQPYGGTIDDVIETAMTPKGRVDIFDLKTGKDIYLEAKIQVASYGSLWNEHHPEMPVAGYHILRLGPEGEFTHKYFPTLDPRYFEIFLDCLDINETLSVLGEKL